MTELPELALDREFAAPVARVWATWSDPVMLARWYGPNVQTVIHEFDLKPGGRWLNEMKFGENSMFERVTFQVVEPCVRLEWLHATANADWQVSPNPMMPDWPPELQTTVEFEDRGDVTGVRFVWVPHQATAAQIACFAGAKDQMGGGWEAGFAGIDQILAETASG